MTDGYFQFGLPVAGTSAQSDVVRQQLDALGKTNATASDDNPPNPKNGMLRVRYFSDTRIELQLFWGSWRTFWSTNLAGLTRLEQAFSSSATWNYQHGLGVKPLVQCFDTNDELIVPGGIKHIDVNEVQVTHTAPRAGYMIVVG